MDPEISIPQQQNLQSFAEQRDALISEISIKRSELETITKTTTELEAHNSFLNKEIAQKEKAIELMETFEEERSLLISQNLSGLITKYQTLTEVVPLLEKQVETLNNEIDIKTKQLSAFTETMDYQIKQVKGLDEVVRNTVRINTENLSELNHFIVSARNSVESLSIIDSYVAKVKSLSDFFTESEKRSKLYLALSKELVDKLREPNKE